MDVMSTEWSCDLCVINQSPSFNSNKIKKYSQRIDELVRSCVKCNTQLRFGVGEPMATAKYGNSVIIASIKSEKMPKNQGKM